MNQPLFPISKETYFKMCDTWCAVINRHDCASILNFSTRTQNYRVHQFLEEQEYLKQSIPDFSSIQFIIINLLAQPFETSEDLEAFISEQKKKEYTRVVFFIIGADTLLHSNRDLLKTFNTLSLQNFNYTLLYFFQQNILYPWIQKELQHASSLFQNIIVEKLYGLEDQNQFIHYAEERAQVTIPEHFNKRIHAECGGRLWLISEVVRSFSKDKNESVVFSSPELTKKIEVIWHEFSSVEQNTLIKCIQKDPLFTADEQRVLTYFETIGLLIRAHETYYCTIGLLTRYITAEQKKNMNLSVNERGDLTINSLVVNSLFTVKERTLLKILLIKQEQTLSREELGSAVWKTEEFTDWALDQLVRRLRNKLVALHILSIKIETVRNHGYQLNNSI